MKTLACLGLLAAALAAGPAHADGCGGKLVDYVKIKNDSGTVIGQLQLYYNADNGMNCAVNVHSDETWGDPMRTGVYLQICDNDSCSKFHENQRDADEGIYKYQAGPIRDNGKGICVIALGSMNKRGHDDPLAVDFLVSTRKHCG